MKLQRHFLLPVLTLALAASAQTSPVPPPAFTPQAQPAPCGTAAAVYKPTLKVPSSLQMAFEKYSPISGADIGKTLNAPKLVPCPPPPPNTQLAPVLKMPLGVITTWLCNPVVTSTDASHTATLVTPDELAVSEPLSAGAFEADGAKADLKAATSCANLRRDAKNNKVFLAQ